MEEVSKMWGLHIYGNYYQVFERNDVKRKELEKGENIKIPKDSIKFPKLYLKYILKSRTYFQMKLSFIFL